MSVYKAGRFKPIRMRGPDLRSCCPSRDIVTNALNRLIDKASVANWLKEHGPTRLE